MKKPKYTIDKNEVYTLELQKLQHCLSAVQRTSEDAGKLEKLTWRHVEFMRQANFMLSQALHLTQDVLELPG